MVSNTKYKIPKTVTTKTGQQQHQTVAYEVDIIAVNPLTKEKIWGEVKGWETGVQKRHFKALWKEHREWQRTTKLFNNPNLRQELRSRIEEKYGPSFKLVLYCDHIKTSDRDSIMNHAKKMDFQIVEMDSIVTGILKLRDEQAYSNDAVMQMLRIMYRLEQRQMKLHPPEFPAYISGQSCIKKGKQHQYANRGTYDVCSLCGSSRTHRNGG